MFPAGPTGWLAFRQPAARAVNVVKSLIPVLLAALALAAATRAAALSDAEARSRLAAGAVLVDVRTPEEFRERSLPGAVNLPLATIAQTITNRVPDKGAVVLLHCRSGARSGTAETQLRALGYTNVFNLGSFSRAEKVASGAKP